MTKKELELILKKHSLWLEDNTKGERANLSRAYLYGANLNGANLSRANLYEADLYEANLSRANLSRANLIGADLSGADLSGADLKDATLPGFQIPQDKIIIVYKKLYDDRIAHVRITEKAKRTAKLCCLCKKRTGLPVCEKCDYTLKSNHNQIRAWLLDWQFAIVEEAIGLGWGEWFTMSLSDGDVVGFRFLGYSK